MDLKELVALIERGIPPGARQKPCVWADFGAGEGNFTRALMGLIASSSIIYAVDRDKSALTRLRQRISLEPSPSVEVRSIHADYATSLELPPLDGILAANSLHFLKDQRKALLHILGFIKPDGRLIIVEYDVTIARPWIPHPLSFRQLSAMARRIGLDEPKLIGTRKSRWSGNNRLYAAVLQK